MAVLDPVSIVDAASAAGFRYGGGLDIIVAIGKVESGFDETAISPVNTDGSTDYGWPQINSNHLPDGKYRTLATNVEALAYAERVLGHPWTKDDLLVAIHAATAAWILSSHGHSFTPWTTYNSGAYKTHILLAQVARRLMQAQDEIGSLGLHVTTLQAQLDSTKTSLIVVAIDRDAALAKIAAAKQALA